MIIKTTAELRQHISIISSNDFDNLKPYLKRAKRYIIRVIGQPSWDAALAHYISNDYTNVHIDDYEQADEALKRLDYLVDRIQDPLVFYAYHLYSPQANVILTDTGYQVAWNDKLRPAQEWHVNRAELSLLDGAHELMDDLIDYLDTNEENFDFWKNSDALKASRSLFINNARTFSQYYNIKNSRRLFIEILPIIKEVERLHILPVITQTIFDSIKGEIEGGQVTAPNQAILERLCPALAFKTMSLAVIRMSPDILPSGIYKNYLSNFENIKSRNPARIEVLNSISMHLKDHAMTDLKILEKYLYDNEILTLPEEETETSETYVPTDSELSQRKYFKM